MRMPRLKFQDRAAIYHCMSKIVGGQHLMGPREREKLRHLIYRLALFCGIKIRSHSEMSNHFHVVIDVPRKINISDTTLLKRLRQFYGAQDPRVVLLQEQVEKYSKIPGDLRERYLRRMYDISIFMQELKQAFSKWFNATQDRRGTLWSERFKSVLVENSLEALRAVCAYVDLNPVRAGLVKDPAHYPYCSYADALSGHHQARRGLGALYPPGHWKEVKVAYRDYLLGHTVRKSKGRQHSLDQQTIRELLAEGKPLNMAQALRLQLRYMNDGVALGSEQFANEIFRHFRHLFGPRRRTGARRIRLRALENFRVLRDLQKRIME